MITEKVLDSVYPLRSQLTEKGHSLSVVGGSPLAELVDANLSPMASAMAATPESPVPSNLLLDDSKRPSPDGERHHDLAMKELVDLAATAVTGSFHLTRNEVVPATKAVHGIYAERLQEMEIDAKQPAMIIPNIYHEIWASAELNGLVERFENVPLNEAKATYSLPGIEGATLMAMMKTGIAKFDELVEDWFENQPMEKMMMTYKGVFTNGQVHIGRATNAVHVTNNGMLDRNDLLLVFLVASNFEEHMPDGMTVSLDQLRLMLSRIREQAGRAIAAELVRRDRDRRNKTLIYEVNKHDWEFSTDGRTVIKVNNDVYKAFLEEGGTPESIYGAVVSGANTSYQTLLDERDKNESRWTRHAGMHTQKVAAQIFSSQREAARLAMTKYINSLDEETLLRPRSDLHAKTVEVLGKMQPKDFSDDLTAVRRVVCEVLYAHTNARMVLDAMDTAEMENPEMNARECALLACIDLVARWMAAQINVKYSK